MKLPRWTRNLALPFVLAGCVNQVPVIPRIAISDGSAERLERVALLHGERSDEDEDRAADARADIERDPSQTRVVFHWRNGDDALAWKFTCEGLEVSSLGRPVGLVSFAPRGPCRVLESNESGGTLAGTVEYGAVTVKFSTVPGERAALISVRGPTSSVALSDCAESLRGVVGGGTPFDGPPSREAEGSVRQLVWGHPSTSAASKFRACDGVRAEGTYVALTSNASSGPSALAISGTDGAISYPCNLHAEGEGPSAPGAPPFERPACCGCADGSGLQTTSGDFVVVAGKSPGEGAIVAELMRASGEEPVTRTRAEMWKPGSLFDERGNRLFGVVPVATKRGYEAELPPGKFLYGSDFSTAVPLE